MRKGRFTEAWMVAALRQAESGVPVAELCQKQATCGLPSNLDLAVPSSPAGIGDFGARNGFALPGGRFA